MRDLGGLDQLLAGLEVQLGVGAHRREDLARGRRCRPPRGRGSRYSSASLVDLGQPDVVDLLGGLVGGRVVAQRRGVRLVPAGAASSGRHARRAGPCGSTSSRSTSRYASIPGVRRTRPPRAAGPSSRRRRGRRAATSVDQQRVVGHRRRQQAVELRDRVGARRTRRAAGRWRRPRAAARPARGSSGPCPRNFSTSASATSASGSASIAASRSACETCTPKIGSAAISLEPRLQDVGRGGGVGDEHVAGDALLLVQPALVDRLRARREVPQGRDLAVLRLPGRLLELARPGRTRRAGARSSGWCSR